MYKFGNSEKSKLGLIEKNNKYEESDFVVDLNSTNDSHSIIANEIIKSGSNLTVLDVGCGSGLLGKFFLGYDNIIIDGIEIDKVAANHAKKVGKYRKIYENSIEDFLTKNKNKYDIIVFSDVLEHLVEPYTIIYKTVKFILNKGGKLLISLPNVGHIDVISNLINGNFNYNDVGTLDATHLRFFTIKSFAQMIANVNSTNNITLDLKLISKTYTYPENIDYESEIYKMININDTASALQFIFAIEESKEANNLKLILDIDYKDIYKNIEEEVKNKNELSKKCNFLIDEQSALYESIQAMNKQMLEYKNLYYTVVCSRTWKIMEPVRKAKNLTLKILNKSKRVKNIITSSIDVPSIKNENNLKPIRISLDEFVDYLSEYDVISFDIFDTLIFRPFVYPTDLFRLIENNEKIDNFAQLRVKAEQEARRKTSKKNYEINIFDIYNVLKTYNNIDVDATIKIEWDYERSLCYANEFMLSIIEELKAKNKIVVLTSDMYWPKEYLESLIKEKGFNKVDNVYVSCDFEINKGNGCLQKKVIEDYKGKKIIHVGDNYESDILGSKKANIDTYYYKSCLKIALDRIDPVYDISLIESVTSAIRYNYLYSGLNNYSLYYEYGFNYGGILTCGFLDYINDVAKNKNIDKILFLARDAKIFYEVYNEHYKQVPNDYMIISRSAMYEACFESKTEDFIDFYFLPRMLKGKYTIESSLIETDMKFLVPVLRKYDLEPQEYLTNTNFENFKNMIYSEKKLIVSNFSSSKSAAVKYFKEVIGSAKKILAVDLGWSGSIITLMRFFIKENISSEIELYASFVGNKDSHKVNALIDQNIFFPYCFSYNINRDLYIDIGTEIGSGQAMLLEAMFTSTSPSLLKYEDNFVYSKLLTNDETLNEIHKGIKDFAKLYNSFGFNKKYNLKLNSRSAFRPLRNALNNSLINYVVFKNYKEYKDSLPHFVGDRDITTIGQIMKNRNMM